MTQAIAITFDANALAPLIRQVATEVVRQLAVMTERLPDRLAFSEQESARLLGLEPHVLRDERRRGKIKFSRIVGSRIRYMRSDLVEYLMGRRCDGT